MHYEAVHPNQTRILDYLEQQARTRVPPPQVVPKSTFESSVVNVAATWNEGREPVLVEKVL